MNFITTLSREEEDYEVEVEFSAERRSFENGYSGDLTIEQVTHEGKPILYTQEEHEQLRHEAERHLATW